MVLVPRCVGTWEGDNTILSLQAGRSLISAYEDAQRGKKLASGVAYLNDRSFLNARCASDSVSASLETMDAAWATVAANVVKKAAEVYATKLKMGVNKDVAMEGCSHERFCAAKIHTLGYIYRQFLDALMTLESEEPSGSSTVSTLRTICQLYGAYQYVLTPSPVSYFESLIGSDHFAELKRMRLISSSMASILLNRWI